MSTQIKQLRAKLKKINGLQWSKKQQLRCAIRQQADAQRAMHSTYIQRPAAKNFQKTSRTISRLTKDMNRRRFEIRQLEWQIEAIKVHMEKTVYLMHPKDSRGCVHGIHASGIRGPFGEFYQEEIWANNYWLNSDGKYEFKGGSMRISDDFDEVVQEFIKQGYTEVNIEVV